MIKRSIKTKAISKRIKDKRGDGAIYMPLLHTSVSTGSWALVEELADELWALEARRRKPDAAFTDALEAVLHDLMSAEGRVTGQWSYRPFGDESFIDLPVTVWAARQARSTLKRAGYIEIDPDSGLADGHATRLRGTADLFEMAAIYGVTPSNIGEHFTRRPRPTELTGAVRLKTNLGAKLKIDFSHPTAAALRDRVNEINGFVSRQGIEPDNHWVFYRGFNQGDLLDFRWNKGGRLYSVGAGSYQQQKSAVRGAMTINGEAVVEIDIQASHLTILRHRLGIAFDPTDDAYEGVPGVPRHVAKAWVVMTLGYDRLHKRWSPEAKRYHIKKGGKDLTKEYPLEKVRAKMLAHLPFMADWETSPIRWGDLQFLESEAVIGAVHELATVHGIPALPVHDSLIVPASHKEKAMEALKASFKKVVGIEPHLTIK